MEQRVRGGKHEREFFCNRCGRWRQRVRLYGREFVCGECDWPEREIAMSLQRRSRTLREEAQRAREESQLLRQAAERVRLER